MKARKSEKSLVVGLDVGTSKIVAIVGECQPDGAVEVIVSIPSLTLGSVSSQAMGPDFFDAETHPTAIFAADIAVSISTGDMSGIFRLRQRPYACILRAGIIRSGSE